MRLSSLPITTACHNIWRSRSYQSSMEQGKILLPILHLNYHHHIADHELNSHSFLGRTVPNVIADKAGRFNVMVVMSLASGILCLALWLPGRSNGASIAFAILFGITSGAVVGIGPVLIAGISPMRELGTRMGTILAIAAIGTLTAPPIGTAIAQNSGGDYTFSALFAGVDFVVAGIGVWILRTRISGWSLATKA